ncbi:hypothetical protein ACRALDRAFT_211778 [Sodiomyces alcalophilus JCM 7366]|uniref:uncharacterized protein n=1 Tax=Sodiomyces alcalophilus JCM 7366 TaxID=591952 RepID=UPI0039B5D9F1
MAFHVSTRADRPEMNDCLTLPFPREAGKISQVQIKLDVECESGRMMRTSPAAKESSGSIYAQDTDRKTHLLQRDDPIIARPLFPRARKPLTFLVPPARSCLAFPRPTKPLFANGHVVFLPGHSSHGSLVATRKRKKENAKHRQLTRLKWKRCVGSLQVLALRSAAVHRSWSGWNQRCGPQSYLSSSTESECTSPSFLSFWKASVQTWHHLFVSQIFKRKENGKFRSLEILGKLRNKTINITTPPTSYNTGCPEKRKQGAHWCLASQSLPSKACSTTSLDPTSPTRLARSHGASILLYITGNSCQILGDGPSKGRGNSCQSRCKRNQPKTIDRFAEMGSFRGRVANTPAQPREIFPGLETIFCPWSPISAPNYVSIRDWTTNDDKTTTSHTHARGLSDRLLFGSWTIHTESPPFRASFPSSPCHASPIHVASRKPYADTCLSCYGVVANKENPTSPLRKKRGKKKQSTLDTLTGDKIRRARKRTDGDIFDIAQASTPPCLSCFEKPAAPGHGMPFAYSASLLYLFALPLPLDIPIGQNAVVSPSFNPNNCPCVLRRTCTS